MNKLRYILLFVLLGVSLNTYSQVPIFSNWSTNYLNIYSYEGTFQSDAITIRISQTGFLNISNWKLSVNASSTVIGNGKQFPVDKISLPPSRTAGQANDPGPLPTISEIGVINNVFLINNSDVYLVPNSGTPVYNKGTNNTYYDLQLVFNLNVLGGNYLTDLKTNSPQYPIRMQFTLYGANNEVLGTTVVNYTFQVHSNLTGTPPSDNSYSIQVSSAARNGVLNVSSLGDYANGASVTYTNGLMVSSSTNYQISVKSTSAAFSSARGYTLPLGIVNVALLPTSGVSALVSPRPLSNMSQILSSGNSTNRLPIYYDIKYYTSPNDDRLVQSEMDEYKINLQYEITPR